MRAGEYFWFRVRNLYLSPSVTEAVISGVPSVADFGDNRKLLYLEFSLSGKGKGKGGQ